MKHAQVKSRKRVTEHGEVYTNSREVEAMLDLVESETERIDSRFLEPACGHGNFLSTILERKLDVVESTYKASQIEFERYAIIAIGSIYGIDKLSDNIDETRERLFGILTERYFGLFKAAGNPEFLNAARFILNRNIIVGDALDLRTESGEPIVFSEWSLVVGDLIKRRDYAFDHLVNRIGGGGPLFPDEAFVPETVAEFPPVNYKWIANAFD